MIDNQDQVHEVMVKNICSHTCKLLKYPKMEIKIMRRTREIKKNSSYVMGHTKIGGNSITLDIYTARLRKPKKISAILSVLVHEIAHHQKPPYRQWHRGKWIVRQHFPKFYKQVTKNINKMKRDEMVGKYF